MVFAFPLARPVPPELGTWQWKASRARQIIRREGWRTCLFRVLARLGYRRYVWYACRLDAAATPEACSVEGLEMRQLERGDVQAYLAFRRGATDEQYRSRMEDGFTLHAACVNGRVVSVIWTCSSKACLQRLQLPFDLEDDELCFYDGYTHEDFRGRRIQASLCAWVLASYRAKGCRWAYSLIRPENRSSIASRARSGFRPIGLLRTFQVGERRRHVFRGLRRPPDSW